MRRKQQQKHEGRKKQNDNSEEKQQQFLGLAIIGLGELRQIAAMEQQVFSHKK
jgi:hypothetical protein